MIELELMPDNSEVVQYKQPEFPMFIYTSNLSDFPNMSIPGHWHEDFEWVHIHQGSMYYCINGKHVVLNEHDSLLVNSRQMHYGYSCQKQNCRLSNILFHPSLFCQNELIQEHYFSPIQKNYGLDYIHFHSDEDLGKETAEFLTQIIRFKETTPKGYLLEIISLMQILWSRLWRQNIFTDDPNRQEMSDDLKAQKNMVSFLYQHYKEKITLDEIAASGNVNRNKCCRIFKHYLQQTPIDFLNAYRLRISTRLLHTTDKSITEIALACGFNHLSYFSKLFYENYGCTPREYRSRVIPE